MAGASAPEIIVEIGDANVRIVPGAIFAIVSSCAISEQTTGAYTESLGIGPELIQTVLNPLRMLLYRGP
jgi:hypothetical protein